MYAEMATVRILLDPTPANANLDTSLQMTVHRASVNTCLY